MKLVYLSVVPAVMALPQLRNIMEGDQDPVHGDITFLRTVFHANYGCYTYFTEEIPDGKFSGGIPVDTFDGLVKVYRGQMDCVDLEHAAPGESAYRVDYENPYDEHGTPIYDLASSNLGGPDPTYAIPSDALIVSECDSLNSLKPNPELCKQACYAETRFMAEYFHLIHIVASGTTDWFSDEFRHDNGFDPASECLATTGAGTLALPGDTSVCCGSAPRRGYLTEIPNIRVCSADGSQICDLLADPGCV